MDTHAKYFIPNWYIKNEWKTFFWSFGLHLVKLNSKICKDQVNPFQPFIRVWGPNSTSFKSKVRSPCQVEPLKRVWFPTPIYRPIEVVLDINIGDVTLHLMKNCLPKDPPCPFLGKYITEYQDGFDLKVWFQAKDYCKVNGGNL